MRERENQEMMEIEGEETKTECEEIECVDKNR